MGHGPAVKLGKDNASPYKARLGVWMFASYALFYFLFVALNVFFPTSMAIEVFGLNLAIAGGIGLILFAMVLAVIYNHYCTKAESRLNGEGTK